MAAVGPRLASEERRGDTVLEGVALTKTSPWSRASFSSCSAPPAAGRHHVGFVFQFYNLIPSLTARENVALVTDIAPVPLGGVHRLEEGWAAFVVDHGRARLRKVTVGRRNDSEAEVVAGLHEGERVVLYPTDKVEDGARVSAR